MSIPPAKRPRHSDDPSSSSSTTRQDPLITQLTDALNTLPPDQLRYIVASILPSHPYTLQDFLARYQAYLNSIEDQRRKAPPKDFDYLSKSCWKELNITHRKLRPSQQYGITGEVAGVIQSAVREITKGCRDSPRSETKLSALETLRKISKSIILCDEREIRKGVMNDDRTPDSLAHAMVEILDGMNEEEMVGLEETETPNGIRWLVEEYNKYAIDCFDQVLDSLDGDGEEDEED
ncbi:hypothetical protein L486_00666 [Kwoniella mangroviensis CBS 10435]|uniref:Uncharacterized protein n=1 Tax=Kwoniella mangroviensis CBS 10435 TaxID=1331196 RepID=A0A1B9IZU4_9TREE|nr:uncharacterized protein I203_04197 [Kwoniella mangroviensis CBS 8507]OCF61022.1 hypothetical protein L486_00666 [Kwoniella mangroviensis CBS 10435]OCF66621.1 hypothetical protein I203_04197 [Kwoniella mangroviensis CBS 8507]OCF74230.1 hypothetical protein I204_04600 [Kwoniella mangroviensis CBS 8886]